MVIEKHVAINGLTEAVFMERFEEFSRSVSLASAFMTLRMDELASH